jgi:hypothetical protein
MPDKIAHEETSDKWAGGLLCGRIWIGERLRGRNPKS